MKISLGVGMKPRRPLLPVLPPQTWTPVVYSGVVNDPPYTFTNVAGTEADWNSGWDSEELLATDFLTEGYMSPGAGFIFFGMRDLALGRGGGYANGRAWWRTAGDGVLVAGSAYDLDFNAGTFTASTKLGMRRIGTTMQMMRDDVVVHTFSNAGFADGARLWGTMATRTAFCRVIRWDAL